MGISHTAAGTAKAYDDGSGVASVTKSGISAGLGDVVVVQVVCTGAGSPPQGVTWNSLALTKRVDGGDGEINVSQWTRENVGAATGSVVVDTSDSLPFGVNVAVKVVSGAETSGSTDQVAVIGGTSTTPSSGNTATTTRANGLALGLVGWKESGSTINEGAWAGSFTDDQASFNTPSGGFEGDLSTGTRLLSATGAYAAAKTGATNTDWYASILVIKEALSAQTSSPASVGMSSGVSVPTSVPGDVSSSPSSVGMSAGSSAPTSVPGDVASTVESVGMVAGYPLGTSDEVFPLTANRDPTTITSLSFSVIHATNPVELGDDTTTTSVLVDDSSVGATSGTLEVVSTDMENPPAGGSISYVVLRARGAWLYPGGGFNTPGTHRFKLTVGGLEAALACASQFPVLGPEESGLVAQFMGTITSGPATTQPNGSPWDWAAVNAMVNVKVQGDYSKGFGAIASLRVGELWAEVWGEIGPAPDVVPVRAPFGAIHNPGNLGRLEAPGQFNGFHPGGGLGKVRLRFQLGG